ncbi:MAG TPA: threonine/serine exporter family protein [Bacteroidales bacterium]|nr:threonine/serine exporter family protein [Bacteroidales bacterium]
MKEEEDLDIREVGSMLLEVAALLMSSGATTNRVRITVDRISEVFGFEAHMLITNRAITLTLTDEEREEDFHSLKRTSPHGVNFRIVSGISRMSWNVVKEKWTIEQINQELDRLTSLPHYPRLVVLSVVGVAGASFCRIFGGDFIEMVVTFVATFIGLFVRQEALKKEFNPYLCVFFASFTASLISGAFRKLGVGDSMEHAFTASVLFLIPGVPLINSFTDLIDGNILNGVVRGINGLMIAFGIALGLLLANIIYRF